jgi:hypothetical protein
MGNSSSPGVNSLQPFTRLLYFIKALIDSLQNFLHITYDRNIDIYILPISAASMSI